MVVVASIAALAIGVMWKAGHSAREAARANRLADQAAQQAARANRLAQQTAEEAARANAETARAEAELWNARFTEARAVRQAGGVGARSKSAQIVAELARSAGLTDAQRSGLRTEVIGQLGMVDLDLPENFNQQLVPLHPIWDAGFTRYAMTHGGNSVQIFDAVSRQEVGSVSAPIGYGRAGLALSADGRLVAGAFSFRDRVRCVLAWRIATGTLILSNATISAGGYHKPFFSPDARTLAIYTRRGLELHSCETNGPPRILSADEPATFSPDSQELAAVVNQTKIQIWRVDSGESAAKFSAESPVSCLAWQPDGRSLALGGTKGELAIWACPGKNREPVAAGPLRRFKGHTRFVSDVQFSPNGLRLISISWDGFSGIWSVEDGRRLLWETRLGFRQFSADGRQVALWMGPKLNAGLSPWLDQTGFRTMQAVVEPEPRAVGIEFSPDGRLGATDHLEFTRIWSTTSGQDLGRVPGRSPVFLPNGRELLTCTLDRIIQTPLPGSDRPEGADRQIEGVERLHANEARDPSALGRFRFNSLSLAPDQRTLVISAAEAGVILFDLAGERPLRRWTNAPAHYASLTGDGSWLIAQAHRSRTSLLCLTNRTKGARLPDDLNTALSRDGQYLVRSSHRQLTLHRRSASNDWSLAWQISLDLGEGVHTPLAFSPDSRWLALSTNRYEYQLHDVRTGQPLATFTPPSHEPVASRGLTFTGDGRFLRALLHDGEVIEWDLSVVRTELAKLGLDWEEANPSHDLTNRAPAGDDSASPGSARISTPGRPTNDPAATSLPAVSTTAGESIHDLPPGPDGVPAAEPWPKLLVGVAGLLALAASLFLFAYQRRLLAGFARAEQVADERRRQLTHAQEAMFQSQKMEALGTLSAGVAHDFNNLLSIIRMSKQLVSRATRPEGVTKENLEAIEKAVQQGKSLVNSMLGYSRRPAEVVEDFSLAQVIDETVQLLSRQFLSGLKVEVKIDSNCPPVHGSRARLEQALLNLIVNASEAMKNSGRLQFVGRAASPELEPNAAWGPAYVTALAPAVSNPVELLITDSGPGIAPEVLPRIFEPFFTTKNIGATRGTGLGLSLVYTIARQDGWGLAIRTVAGQGTTFRLQLPGARPASGPHLPTSQSGGRRGTLSPPE